MGNINARLEMLRAAQTALREAFYDFQDALLDHTDGAEHHHDVKSCWKKRKNIWTGWNNAPAGPPLT